MKNGGFPPKNPAKPGPCSAQAERHARGVQSVIQVVRGAIGAEAPLRTKVVIALASLAQGQGAKPPPW